MCVQFTGLKFLLGGHGQNNVHNLGQVAVLKEKQETFEDPRVLVKVFPQRQMANQHGEYLG